MKRYHIMVHFVAEERKGFAVHHEMEKDVDDALLVSEILNGFTSEYHQSFCYGLVIKISEEPALVE